MEFRGEHRMQNQKIRILLAQFLDPYVTQFPPLKNRLFLPPFFFGLNEAAISTLEA